MYIVLMKYFLTLGPFILAAPFIQGSRQAPEASPGDAPMEEDYLNCKKVLN